MTVSTAGCLVAAHLRGLSASILSDDRLDDHEGAGAWAPTEQGAARLDLVQVGVDRAARWRWLPGLARDETVHRLDCARVYGGEPPL